MCALQIASSKKQESLDEKNILNDVEVKISELIKSFDQTD